MDVKIPKIIMQTWKNHTLPEHWLSSPASIKQHMSDWNYVFMTDEDNRTFCATYFPDFLQYYDAFEYPIMKADAIRYMFLYKNGGIYMDLDIKLERPLDDLFYEDHELYLVRSGNFGSYYTNALMASKPGVQFWLKCIEDMKKPYKMWQVGKHLKVMGTTGPLLVTSIIKRNKADIFELPAEQLTACSVCVEKPYTIENGYTTILEGSSWIGNDTKTYIFFTCYWKSVVFIVLVIVILYIVYAVRRSR